MKLEKPTRKIEAVVPAACGNKAVPILVWRGGAAVV